MNLRKKVVRYAVDIVEELQKAGYEAYIVGGAVRDLYLKRAPKDYDISTNATPEEIRKVFGRRRARIIGKRFRLVHLRAGREIVEISTFRRTPLQKKQKRRGDTPEKMIFHDNEYGKVEEDAERRDFSVNALYYDPIADEVKDFSGTGLNDIRDNIVRVIGDPQTRFEEDPVRMIRALKLVGQYGFKMTPETSKALRKSLSLITHVSLSRLSLEFEKIMLSPYCVSILDALYRFGMLKHFLPFIDAKWDTQAGEYMRKLLTVKSERVLSGEYRSSISLSLAAMVLPFIEEEIGFSDAGALWENYGGISYEIRQLLFQVITPLSFCKLVTASTVRMLLIQPDFVEGKNDGLLSERGYSHARELMVLQNIATWHDDKLEEIWPRRGSRSRDDHENGKSGFKKKKRRRKYKPKYGSKKH